MNIRPGLLLILALAPCLLSARTGRYRAMWRHDPSRTMVIGWDLFSGRQSRVLYQPADGDPGTWHVHYPDKMVMAKDMRNHFARLEDLEPDTRYRMVIRDSEGDSPVMYFHTAPDDPSTPMVFVAGGDSRNNRAVRKRINRLVAGMQPLAILFSGDMTDMCTSHEWGEWFDDWQLTITPDRRLIPMVTVRGNHETSNSILVDLFDIPSTDGWYALGFGRDRLRVYSLNSMAPIHGAQTRWLEEDLRTTGQAFTWRVVQYHLPIRPHTRRKKERLDQYDAWAGLFETYHVQIAHESDSHVAKVTWPVRPCKDPEGSEGFVRDDEHGTVYIGEGCWGAPLRPADDPKPWTRALGSFHQVSWLCFREDRLELRVIQTDLSRDARPLETLSRGHLPDGIACWALDDDSERLEIYPDGQSPDPHTDEDPVWLPALTIDSRTSAQVPYVLEAPATVRMEFVNTRRQVVKRLSFQRSAGKFLEGISLRDLPDGRYILKVYANDRLILQQLVGI